MNKILNQNRFRVYPKAGPVPEAPGCAVTSWNRHAIRLALPEVAERCRCRKMFVVVVMWQTTAGCAECTRLSPEGEYSGVS